jgi:biotin--protein ligase
MFRNIQIYSDEGVSSFSLRCLVRSLENLNFKSELITAKNIIEDDWEKDTSIFIMPGGKDLKYLKKLKGKGNEKIKRFVEKGGSYLGICAGAYYASSFVEFNKGKELEVLGKRFLRFFPKKAIGPAYSEPRFCYDSYQGVKVPLIIYEFDEKVVDCFMYFHGGCYFEKDDKTKAIGKYSDLKKNALIYRKMHKGKVILTGVHIECSKDDIKDIDCALLGKLESTENMRKKIFKDILNKLL